MSKNIMNLVLLGTIGLVAACTTTRNDAVVTRQQTAQEFVVVQPAPISVEPTYTSKYK